MARKPNRHEFIRVRPGFDWRLETAVFEDKLTRETYLIAAHILGELADEAKPQCLRLAINRQNRELREQLASAEIRADTLEEHNRELASQSTRYWFMSGGLVLVVGIILGIWLPRIRWQRRSRYDRF